jgi:hypothetical protein
MQDDSSSRVSRLLSDEHSLTPDEKVVVSSTYTRNNWMATGVLDRTARSMTMALLHLEIAGFNVAAEFAFSMPCDQT